MNPIQVMQQVMGQIQQFQQNPMQFLTRYNIPSEYANDPNGMIQYMMNSGQLTQQQYNQANSLFQQLQSLPQFRNVFKN